MAMMHTETHKVRKRLPDMEISYTRVSIKVTSEKKMQFPALFSCTPTGLLGQIYLLLDLFQGNSCRIQLDDGFVTDAIHGAAPALAYHRSVSHINLPQGLFHLHEHGEFRHLKDFINIFGYIADDQLLVPQLFLYSQQQAQPGTGDIGEVPGLEDKLLTGMRSHNLVQFSL